MATTNPRNVACPACNAKPGAPCTSPTNTSRAPIKRYHFVREYEAQEIDRRAAANQAEMAAKAAAAAEEIS